jgi:hypothetical protein
LANQVSVFFIFKPFKTSVRSSHQKATDSPIGVDSSSQSMSKTRPAEPPVITWRK